MKRLFQSLALAASLMAVSTVAAPLANATTPGTVEPKDPVATEAASAFTVSTRLVSEARELRFFVQKQAKTPVFVVLKNEQGAVLFESTIARHANGKAYSLHMNDLPDGTYTIEVSNRDKKEVKAFALKTPERQVAMK
jgi:hypothetical protein